MSDLSAIENELVRPADAEGIALAARALRDGELVSFPTETVYGLGADATNDVAVAEIFAAKARPQFNPLIVHVADLAQARALGEFSQVAIRLADAFWPGPLTLVVPRKPDCAASLLVSAGLNTIALRVPAHPIAQDLIARAQCPIAAPSANISGQVSPTLASHVAKGLGNKVSVILDGGPCSVGIESTIVGFKGGRALMLRPGGITRAALEDVLGTLDEATSDADRPTSPGQLVTHYAPMAQVRLNAVKVERHEALLAFGESVPQGAEETLNLSPTADLTEAAANLFAYLRLLDRPDITSIAVMRIPRDGLGEAINDRLERAAAPRQGAST